MARPPTVPDHRIRPAIGVWPAADSARLVDAPPVCGRCGGCWVRCDEGLRCVACGTRWRVVECLERVLVLGRDEALSP